MMYDTILARSFSRHDQKKLGYGAFLGFLIIALSFYSLLKHLGPLPILNLSLSSGKGLRMLVVGETNRTRQFVSGAGIATDSQVGETIGNETRTNGTSEQVVRDSRIGETATKTTVQQSVIIPAADSQAQEAKPEKAETNNTQQNVMIPAPDSQVQEAKPEKAETNTTSQQIVITESKAISETNTREIRERAESLSCNFKEPRSDFCEMSGDIRVQGSSSTVFIATSKSSNLTVHNMTSWSLRPYARKGDLAAMNDVREWSVSMKPEKHLAPKCSINHNVPAILFSSGGYAGNHFHAFSDVIIPLYLTSIRFDRQVQFLISNSYPRWANKFREILKGLSRFDPIDIDRSQQVHCFPSITIGLKHHRELTIDPSRSQLSMTGFRHFLRTSYSLKRSNAAQKGQNKPRLLIISRKWSRSFTNSPSIAKMATALGFEVIVSEADLKLPRFAELVNSCDVMMGVHGAGLTNMVFLPENAVVIQVVPLGNMAWLANTYFKAPSKDMNISYLEYSIRERESTLTEQYQKDDVVMKDPSVLMKQGWEAFKAVYMEKQNVRLDVRRFKPTLLKALALLDHKQQ